MFIFRPPARIAFLIATVTVPRLVGAQAVSDRTAIEAATLADAAVRARTRADYDSLRYYFDPTIVQGWWDNGIRRNAPARTRDSAEAAALVSAFRGTPVTPAMLSACGGRPARRECPRAVQEGAVFAISDPRVIGDTATVLLRVGPSSNIGSDRPSGGLAMGSIKLVRLVRREGRWVVLCSAMIGADYESPAKEVEAKCTAQVRGRGD